MNKPEFKPFPKVPRFSRDIVITEKLDGTNASVTITESGDIFAGSRTRWITPEDDNYGFAKWVEGHKDELLKLGVGTHFGEWWGQGIQRNYGLKEKRFSLFNVSRWTNETKPECCHVVPVLWSGEMSGLNVYYTLIILAEEGSTAVPGFMKPEGIMIYHTAANQYFKKTIEKDQEGKGQ